VLKIKIQGVRDTLPYSTAILFSFGVLSPNGEAPNKKGGANKLHEYMQPIDPAWSFIDATSSMVFNI